MTKNPLIKIVAYVNYAIILLHIFLAYRLTQTNQDARPVQYSFSNPSANSS
jgi:hypothetical protein